MSALLKNFFGNKPKQPTTPPVTPPRFLGGKKPPVPKSAPDAGATPVPTPPLWRSLMGK